MFRFPFRVNPPPPPAWFIYSSVDDPGNYGSSVSVWQLKNIKFCGAEVSSYSTVIWSGSTTFIHNDNTHPWLPLNIIT
jgi:hypothetical protein